MGLFTWTFAIYLKKTKHLEVTFKYYSNKCYSIVSRRFMLTLISLNYGIMKSNLRGV